MLMIIGGPMAIYLLCLDPPALVQPERQQPNQLDFGSDI